MTGVELSHRQKALLHLVLAQATSIDEQMLIVSTCAKRVDSTPADVNAVRAALLTGHTRECSA